MKKLLYLLLPAVILISGCSNKTQESINAPSNNTLSVNIPSNETISTETTTEPPKIEDDDTLINNDNYESEEMDNMSIYNFVDSLPDVTSIPDGYKNAADEDKQGKIEEFSYTVGNYINKERQLVTTVNISQEEAGRETVTGDAITKKCNIYTPAGYDKDNKNIKYNVLYLLHGVGGNRYEWLNGSGNIGGRYVIVNILDNLIANGDIEPVIVVIPEGRSSVDWTSNAFTSDEPNILGFYYFDYELRYDLIPYIESEYNTYADIKNTENAAYNRQHRAIGGLSMGGMQSLNMIVGGYRYDSATFAGGVGDPGNGLVPTVKAPGMLDLFAYIGTFSNAPTSSEGSVIGNSISSYSDKLDLLYMTCGDADGIAYNSYNGSINGLPEAAGDNLCEFYRVVMTGKGHDFNVWNNGAYNFARLAFKKVTGNNEPKYTDIRID